MVSRIFCQKYAREDFRNFHTYSAHHTVWKNERLMQRKNKKIPSNQFRVELSSKKLIRRNFCDKIVVVNFRNFHSCEKKVTLTEFLR